MKSASQIPCSGACAVSAWLLAMIAVLCSTLAVVAKPLDTLQRSYAERVGATDAEHDHRIEKLTASYITALERQLATTQRAGNLEEVLVLKEEIESLKDPKAGPKPLPATAKPTLVKLRETYDESVTKASAEHAAKRVDLADRMAKALKDLEVQQTKDGEIEGAVASRAALQTLQDDAELAAARALAGVEVPAVELGVGSWRSLSDANFRIVEKGGFPVGWLTDDLGAAATNILPDMQRAADGKPALVTVPNATVEIRVARPFRKLRFRAHLAMEGGDVEFRVSVKGRVVERFTLKDRVGGRDIELDLGNTQVVELSVFDNGSPNGDWAMWIDPQVR
jgi:hypothetical protein